MPCLARRLPAVAGVAAPLQIGELVGAALRPREDVVGVLGWATARAEGVAGEHQAAEAGPGTPYPLAAEEGRAWSMARRTVFLHRGQ